MLELRERTDGYMKGTIHLRSTQCTGHKDRQRLPNMVLAILGIQEPSQAVMLLVEAWVQQAWVQQAWEQQAWVRVERGLPGTLNVQCVHWYWYLVRSHRKDYNI
jgi:hypothetical protein